MRRLASYSNLWSPRFVTWGRLETPYPDPNCLWTWESTPHTIDSTEAINLLHLSLRDACSSEFEYPVFNLTTAKTQIVQHAVSSSTTHGLSFLRCLQLMMGSVFESGPSANARVVPRLRGVPSCSTSGLRRAVSTSNQTSPEASAI